MGIQFDYRSRLRDARQSPPKSAEPLRVVPANPTWALNPNSMVEPEGPPYAGWSASGNQRGGVMGLVRRAWVSFLGATVACLVLVPAAHAALGFQGLSAAPTNTTAGAHSDLNIHIGFTGASDNVKDLTVSLPPGMVGN